MSVDTDSATDPLNARDISGRDPILVWLHKAEVSHARMTKLASDYHEECRWRRECVKMVIAMGGTSGLVAERLNVSRPNIAKLAR